MKKARVLGAIVLSLFCLTIVSYSSQAGLAPPATSPQSGPVMFIENAGQFAEGAQFQMRGGDRTVWLVEEGIWITVLGPSEAREEAESPGLPDYPAIRPGGESAAMPDLGVNLRLSFVGANPQPVLEGFRPLTTTISYFIGNDPDQWAAAVPVWGGVRYFDLYPGLDLELGGEEGMRLVCRAAGCQDSLAQVRLQVEGADSLVLMDDGLVVETAAGDFSLPWLEVVDGQGRPVGVEGSEPGLEGTVVSNPLAKPRLDRPDSPRLQNDVFLPLVMRPTPLLYGTYLGGNSDDEGRGIAVDSAGQAYVTGWTSSADFPTTPGAFDPTIGSQSNSDAFVAKLNAAGSGLLYATYLGGYYVDYGTGIAVDGAGQAVVTGSTFAYDFPTTPGAFDPTHNGDLDAFVVKLNVNGSGLIYSSYLGGSGWEDGYGVAIDNVGQVYLTGQASASSDFPTTPGAFDPTHNGVYDAYVVKVNAAGSGLVYGTYLGGGAWDSGQGIAVDSTGQAYVTGWTSSADFPITPVAFDPTYNDGGDAFAATLSPSGSVLLYGTFLGGNSWESGRSISVDGTGQAYVTGVTGSAGFPTTPGAFDATYNGGDDAFVVRFNALGSGLLYATFVGGSDQDLGNGIAVDTAGQAYVTGRTYSTDFPTTLTALDSTLGEDDGFVVRLNAAGSELHFGTFLGSDGPNEWAAGIALDDGGHVYVTGYATSDDFPTTPGAFDPTYNFSGDAFVVKMRVSQ